MRRHPDGSFWLVRSNEQIEKQFDKDMVRMGNELRWVPKNIGFKLERFNNQYKDKSKIALIIGKGPSLDKLNEYMIKSWHVPFFINDSVKKANQLKIEGYSVQQDGNLQDTCILQKGLHFLSCYAQGWNTKATIYNPTELGFSPGTPTIIAAIKLAKFMGITQFELYGFDALKTNKITDYANIIGYSSKKHRKPPERFFKQAKMVEAELKGFKWRYL